MIRRCVAVVLIAVVIIVIAGIVAASRFNLSALPEPGRVETYAANHARHFLVRTSSRNGIPAEPPVTPAAIDEGDTLFGTECAACHGANAHTPTDAGRWMYPRAADLTSPEVQSYSDRELFWIVKNGIRLSGMPAFGRVEPDEHVWDLVHYLRTLHRDEISAKP
ncbi:MAG: c-type cytochrome [Candidatus Acidiferrales bacterium]